MEKRMISPASVAAFARRLREDERSPGTIENYLRHVRAFAALWPLPFPAGGAEKLPPLLQKVGAVFLKGTSHRYAAKNRAARRAGSRWGSLFCRSPFRHAPMPRRRAGPSLGFGAPFLLKQNFCISPKKEPIHLFS